MKGLLFVLLAAFTAVNTAILRPPEEASETDEADDIHLIFKSLHDATIFAPFECRSESHEWDVRNVPFRKLSQTIKTEDNVFDFDISITNIGYEKCGAVPQYHLWTDNKLNLSVNVTASINLKGNLAWNATLADGIKAYSNGSILIQWANLGLNVSMNYYLNDTEFKFDDLVTDLQFSAPSIQVSRFFQDNEIEKVYETISESLDRLLRSTLGFVAKTHVAQLNEFLKGLNLQETYALFKQTEEERGIGFAL